MPERNRFHKQAGVERWLFDSIYAGYFHCPQKSNVFIAPVFSALTDKIPSKLFKDYSIDSNNFCSCCKYFSAAFENT